MYTGIYIGVRVTESLKLYILNENGIDLIDF